MIQEKMLKALMLKTAIVELQVAVSNINTKYLSEDDQNILLNNTSALIHNMQREYTLIMNDFIKEYAPISPNKQD